MLGLTATPERADGQSILEMFCDSAHRLDLKTAIERGELVPIRCVRVKTNVDLSKVRFKQVQYNRKDIEERILIPPRDQLIVDTYIDHVPGRKAVVFCVNVRHGENIAELFRKRGISARSVSGRMSTSERDDCMKAYRAGDVDVLSSGLSAPYHFLGPCDDVSHSGSRPVSITWQLQHAVPTRLLRTMQRQIAI